MSVRPRTSAGRWPCTLLMNLRFYLELADWDMRAAVKEYQADYQFEK